jgi:hypothetical protein
VRELPLSQLFIESDELGDSAIAYGLVSETKQMDSLELSQHVAKNIYGLLTAYREE